MASGETACGTSLALLPIGSGRVKQGQRERPAPLRDAVLFRCGRLAGAGVHGALATFTDFVFELMSPFLTVRDFGDLGRSPLPRASWVN